MGVGGKGRVSGAKEWRVTKNNSRARDDGRQQLQAASAAATDQGQPSPACGIRGPAGMRRRAAGTIASATTRRLCSARRRTTRRPFKLRRKPQRGGKGMPALCQTTSQRCDTDRHRQAQTSIHHPPMRQPPTNEGPQTPHAAGLSRRLLMSRGRAYVGALRSASSLLALPNSDRLVSCHCARPQLCLPVDGCTMYIQTYLRAVRRSLVRRVSPAQQLSAARLMAQHLSAAARTPTLTHRGSSTQSAPHALPQATRGREIGPHMAASSVRRRRRDAYVLIQSQDPPQPPRHSNDAGRCSSLTLETLSLLADRQARQRPSSSIWVAAIVIGGLDDARSPVLLTVRSVEPSPLFSRRTSLYQAPDRRMRAERRCSRSRRADGRDGDGVPGTVCQARVGGQRAQRGGI